MKFVTPGQLAICLVLFFLPWIEVQCPSPDFNDLDNTKSIKPGQPPPRVDPKKVTYRSMLTQSGFQVAAGNYTISDPDMQKMRDTSKKMGNDKRGKDGGGNEDEISSAPLLFLYPLAVIAGIVVGLVLPGSGLKKGILIGCCAVALLTAAGQAAVGFPVEKKIKEPKNQNKKGGPNDEDTIRLASNEDLKIVFKFPFYLALILPIGGIVTAALEPTETATKYGQKYGKQKRKYYQDDEDDEDDDDRRDDDDDRRDDDDDDDDEGDSRKRRRRR